MQAAPSSSVETKVRRAIKKLALPLKQKLIKYIYKNDPLEAVETIKGR